MFGFFLLHVCRGSISSLENSPYWDEPVLSSPDHLMMRHLEIFVLHTKSLEQNALMSLTSEQFLQIIDPERVKYNVII